MGDATAETSLRELSFLSLLAGASSLIPVPVLDDWAFRFVRRQTLERILPENVSLSAQDYRTLVGESPGFFSRGCFYSIFWAPIFMAGYVLKRLFRKVFFFLALKEATDRASQTFHEGFLLTYAFRDASRKQDLVRDLSTARLEQLHWAVQETLGDVDTSPVRKSLRAVFRTSQGVLFEAASHLARLARRGRQIEIPEAEEEEATLEDERRLLNRTLDSLSRMLSAHRDYLDHVRTRFQHYASRRGIHLEEAPVPGGSPGEVATQESV